MLKREPSVLGERVLGKELSGRTVMQSPDDGQPGFEAIFCALYSPNVPLLQQCCSVLRGESSARSSSQTLSF